MSLGIPICSRTLTPLVRKIAIRFPIILDKYVVVTLSINNKCYL